MAMGWLKLVSVVTVWSLVLWGSRVTAISTEELDGVLMILRAQGHMLFANAISTSDMLFDILSVQSLTLLAPTDPTIFALDMTNTPPFYISTLRLHALPMRLSWSQLLLSNGSLLPTLLPSRQLRVLRRRQLNTLVVDGDGGSVEVVMPGLYYSRDVAVHALGGILTLRSKIPRNTSSTNNTFFFPPPPTINNHTTTLFLPTVNNTSNRTLFFPPLPRIPIINHTNPTHALVYPPSESPSPSPAPAPVPDRKMGEVLASLETCAVG